jgi:hypothetical protein
MTNDIAKVLVFLILGVALGLLAAINYMLYKDGK